MPPFIEFSADGRRRLFVNASFIVEAEFFEKEERLKIHVANSTNADGLHTLEGDEAIAAIKTLRKLKK